MSIVLLTVPAASSAHPAHGLSGWLLAIAGLLGGFLVGVTGMGGGALMTPLLVLLFKVDPKIAIASDLVNALVMKPIGGGVHARRGTILWGLVLRLTIGSVPAAFLGAFTLNQFGDSKGLQTDVKKLLGWALILACVSLVARAALTAKAAARRQQARETTNDQPYVVKTLPTVVVGIGGGFIVGLTSVGSGSLMIVLLMLLYPRLSSRSLVGTDLVQALPLVASATLGQFFFGHINFGLAGALIVGSVPGVYLGARLSSRAPDGVVKPLLILVLASSALALLFGGNNSGLGLALAIGVMIGVPLWGAVDATLRRSADWQAIGHSRTTWVALLGIGAPFGVGLVAAVPYFLVIRPSLIVTAKAREGVGVGRQERRGDVAQGRIGPGRRTALHRYRRL